MAIARSPIIIVAMLLLAAPLAGCGGYSSIHRPPDAPVDQNDEPRPHRDEADAQQAPGDPGNIAVKMAEEYIGAPYRSGGTTTDGVDCSGLTFGVYRRLGVRLPRSSHEQAYAGTHIDREELRAGDLVFFGKGSNVTHVGIYAEDGEFIHASTRARSVRYDSLDNKYFRNRYIGARRVL